MDEAQQAQEKHEQWLRRSRQRFQLCLQRVVEERLLWITQCLLILLTLERALMESLREFLETMDPQSLDCLRLDLEPSTTDGDCLNPPSNEALIATATQLAHMMNRFDSFKTLNLSHVNSSITTSLVAACLRIEAVLILDCPLVTASVRSILSIKTLRVLHIAEAQLPNLDSADAFCAGIEASSLKELTLFCVAFRPEHDAQLATTLARSKTLVEFIYIAESQLFCVQYCAALITADTKLERLNLVGRKVILTIGHSISHRWTVGVDATTEADMRHVLRLNAEMSAQRETCGPLFVAISDAQTDMARKQCLVAGFLAAGCPLTFEYIRSNHHNVISLIQQLGRTE